MGKEKKHKKKSHKHKKSSKFNSNSDSSNSSDEEWVEMKPVPLTSEKQQDETKKEEIIGSDKDWLMNPALFACISRDELRQKREEKRDKKEDDKYMLDKLGQTNRELNPYWKDGGSGLPQENPVTPESLRQASVTVGDQGVAWLKKALRRAKEQAVEQGRSLEHVVAERWGSLEKLENMIAEAEKREQQPSGLRHQSKSNYKNKVDNSKDKCSNRRNSFSNNDDDTHWSKTRKFSDSKKEANNKMTEEKKSHYSGKLYGNSKQNYKHDYNSTNKNKSFKKPKGSESDSSDCRESNKQIRKSSPEHKKSRFRKPHDKSSEEEMKSDKRYSKKSREEIKVSNMKLSRKPQRSSSSSRSEDDDRYSESDEHTQNDDRCGKHRKKHTGSDRVSKNKQSKKRNVSSSSSSSEGSRNSNYYNRNNHDSRKKSYDGKKKEERKTFIKPQHSSDDDSFASSSQRHSDKPKSYSSSSTQGWRKKTHSLKQEDKVLYDKKEDASVKESISKVEEVPVEPPVEKQQVLTDKEMNDLGAKLVKAELLGNQELAKELKAKLEKAREAKANAPKESEGPEQVVILTHTDAKGFTRPVSLSGSMEPSAGRRKAKKVETHADGKRMRYFADDDKYSLQEMFQREKLSTVEDSNAVFANLASKGVGRNDSARDMDDVFEETARMEEADGRKHARDKQQAIEQSKRTARSLESCQWCLESKKMLKHLIIAMGQTCYLCVPPYQSITEHHCLLVPSHHTPCATQLDEDVWREMQDFRKSVVQMFLSQDEDVVFFESARYLNKFPHMVINCVPMPKETGDLAPIYFKKAIQECEMEWSNNKKLVELKGRDVRRAVPRGLPYFAVDFGMENGFAHVIEDEKLFPQNFAQEIIGGMLDLDHTIWRKQRKQTFEEQSRKVIQLNKLWSEFDCVNKNK